MWWWGGHMTWLDKMRECAVGCVVGEAQHMHCPACLPAHLMVLCPRLPCSSQPAPPYPPCLPTSWSSALGYPAAASQRPPYPPCLPTSSWFSAT